MIRKRKPGPHRIHRMKRRDTTQLLCPCCGGYIHNWPRMQETYRKWNTGRGRIEDFMQYDDITYGYFAFPDKR